MQDRLALFPGRVKLVPVNGQENVYDMTRLDSPTVEGTPLNKASLLTDETAEAIGLDPVAATPSEAMLALNEKATKNKVSITMPAASWVADGEDWKQIVSVPTCTAGSQVDLQLSGIVIKQMKADETMSLYIGNNNGTCTAYATGKKPTTNITVQATVSTVTEVSV